MKGKLFTIILFCLLLFEGRAQNYSATNLLDIPIDSIRECSGSNDIVIAFGSGNIKNGFCCVIEGISFNIAYLEDRKIVYYSTTDSNFLIGNFRYLTSNKAVLDSLKKGGIYFDMDIGLFIALPDGWKLAFYYQDATEKKNKIRLKKNAIPGYLFKTSRGSGLYRVPNVEG